MLGVQNSKTNNALELIMPPAFDEKLVTSDEDRKQLRMVAIALAERFVNHLFGCEPELAAANAERDGLPPLNEFLYKVIRRTNCSITTLFLALIFLIRLKQKHPACKGTQSSPHRLLLAALIIAYKYLYDNCYHNRSWAQVSQGLFKLEEINKMEIELLFFLGFQTYVSKQHWLEFVEFMDGKLTRSLANTENCSHLRKVLWVELFPTDGLTKLHNLTKPSPTDSEPRMEFKAKTVRPSASIPSLVPSLTSSLSEGSTVSSASSTLNSRHSTANLRSLTLSSFKKSQAKLNLHKGTKDISPSSDSTGSPHNSPKINEGRRLLHKVSAVFSKPGDTLNTAWLDLHSTFLPKPKVKRGSENKNPLLNNVTLRSHHKVTSKFNLPPIWSLMQSHDHPKH